MFAVHMPHGIMTAINLGIRPTRLAADATMETALWEVAYNVSQFDNEE